MDTGTQIYQISLIAAYIAGMVALFAPCCISYLLPAYLGNVFKEKKRILFMTLVYSLGIFVVMLPVVLGARALSSFFFRLHDSTYLVGGLFMMLVSFMALLGIKLPMINLTMKQKKGKPDVISTFTLGVFSGITSSCCAPVLIGVITLSSLTPTTMQSLGVGAVYVLGMVTPLYLASLFIHKRNILQNPWLKKKITTFEFGKRKYPIFISNLVSFVVFFTTAGLMMILSSAGKLGMDASEDTVTQAINDVALKVTGITDKFYGLNGIFVIIVLVLVFKFIQSIIKEANE